MKRLHWYGLGCVMLLGLALAALLVNAHLVPGGDNSTYLVLGQSLATGQGYRMVSDPRMPEMGLYPPGYPLLLAGLLGITGTAQNLLAAIVPSKLLSVLLYLVCLVLVWAPDPELCAARIACRVKAGGHSVSETDLRRRLPRILRHLPRYRALADRLLVFDNTGEQPVLVFEQSEDGERIADAARFDRVRLEIGL